MSLARLVCFSLLFWLIAAQQETFHDSLYLGSGASACRIVTCDPFNYTAFPVVAGRTFLSLRNVTTEGYEVQTPAASYNLSIDNNIGKLCVSLQSDALFPFELLVDAIGTKERLCTYNLTIVPVQALPAQEHYLGDGVNVPSPSYDEYTNITSRSLGTRFFNHRDVNVLQVVISSVSLRLNDDFLSQAALRWKPTPPTNVVEVLIVADELEIATLVSLPGTNVSIYARSLTVRPKCGFDVTPIDFDSPPSMSQPGQPGSPSGFISLYVQSFSIDPLAVWMLRGGKGQTGGPAPPAADGRSLSQQYSCGLDSCVYDYYHYAVRDDKFCGHSQYDERHGVKECPTSGNNAQPAGRSGDGGSGGRFLMMVPSQSECSSHGLVYYEGGAQGDAGQGQPGGRAGTPRHARWCRHACFNGACSNCRPGFYRDPDNCVGPNEYACAETHDGNPSATPVGNIGSAGDIECKTANWDWVHPLIFVVIDACARDMLISGVTERAAALLSPYMEMLQANQDVLSLAPWWSKFNGYYLKMNNNLDYYGLPRAWVPHLSFEANAAIFLQEVQFSIPLQYQIWSLLLTNEKLEDQIIRAKTVRDTMMQRVKELKGNLNEKQQQMGKLENDIGLVQFRAHNLEVQITQREQDLRNAAKADAKKAAQLPAWERYLRIGATIAKFIPVPWVQGVGAGINAVLDQVDSGKSAKEIITSLPGIYSAYKNATKDSSVVKILQNLGSDLNKIDFSNAKTVKEVLPDIFKNGKQLGDIWGNIASLNKEKSVSAGEVDKLYKQLVANDKELKDLAAELATVAADQQRVWLTMQQLFHDIAEITNEIAISLQRIYDLQKRIDEEQDLLLDGYSVRMLDSTRRSAEDRLLYWQYLMARSFEYRILETYTSRPINIMLRERLLVFLAKATKNPENLLVGLLLSEFRQNLLVVAEQLEKTIGDEAQTLEFQWDDSMEFLAALNKYGHATLRLAVGDNFLPVGEEQVRIITNDPNAMLQVNMTVNGYTPHPPIDELEVRVTHAPMSVIRKAGVLFQFTHGEAVNFWSTRLNLINKRIHYGAASYSKSSLINFLVSGTDSPFTNRQKGLVLFEEPSLLCELNFQVVHTPRTIPAPPISKLQLSVPYSRVIANPRECEVKVDVVVQGGDGYLPFISVTPTDLNDRNSTIGPCFRLFYCSSMVTLESEALSSQFLFSKWVVTTGSNPPTVVKQLKMALPLADHTLITAYYVPRSLIAP